MGVSGIQNGSPTVNSQHRCQCVDDLLAPIRSKMKVLKKIKKRIRLKKNKRALRLLCTAWEDAATIVNSILACIINLKLSFGSSPRNGSGGTNNLPPILFHQVHGDNIRISGDGTVARRVESFCRGVTFSSRPVKVQEKVCVKFLEVSNNWSGVIRFGFTSNDPSNLRYSLPKYACPDLTNKPGYWAKALAERFAEKDTVLFYYVTQAGDVHFGINGEEKGVFFTGVETRGSLWALFDVYGNSTGIELVDHRTPLNNLRRNGNADTSTDMVTQMLPSLQSLFIQNPNQSSEREIQTDCGSISRYLQTGIELSPLPLHRTRGQNIHMSNDRSIATRIDSEFCLGYVFTSRPVRLGEEIIIQVVETESVYAGGLAFGLTSCDPATLQTCDLPQDADSLLDRPEYWVVQKDVANIPEKGDELAFSVLHTGQVQVSKNRGPPIVFMHVDHTLQLWAFFDLYGTTRKIRVLGTITRPCRNSPQPGAPGRSEPPSSRLRVNLPCTRDQSYGGASHMVNGNNAQVSVNHSNGAPHRYCCASGTTNTTQSSTVTPPSAEVVQLQSTMAGGTVLVVNIPPAHSNYINHQQQQQQQQQQQTTRHSPLSYHASYPHLTQNNSSSNADRGQVPSGTIVSSFNNTYREPISPSSYSALESGIPFGEVMATTTGSECSICYERTIDSVLYMCGHMCMCYECAVQQWRGKGGGHCPLCRAVIRDVIRTYKS